MLIKSTMVLKLNKSIIKYKNINSFSEFQIVRFGCFSTFQCSRDIIVK